MQSLVQKFTSLREMKALKRQGKLYDFHKSQESSNLAVRYGFQCSLFLNKYNSHIIYQRQPKVYFPSPADQNNPLPSSFHQTRLKGNFILLDVCKILDWF